MVSRCAWRPINRRRARKAQPTVRHILDSYTGTNHQRHSVSLHQRVPSTRKVDAPVGLEEVMIVTFHRPRVKCRVQIEWTETENQSFAYSKRAGAVVIESADRDGAPPYKLREVLEGTSE